MGNGSFGVVDETHCDEFAELAVPRSGTHGVAKRTFDRGEHCFREGSLSVIGSCVVCVVAGAELTMFDQWSHAFFA